jgi:D-3-phosphoglycerate dehydrogenase
MSKSPSKTSSKPKSEPSSIGSSRASESGAEQRVLICDELAPAALEIFRERGFEPEVRLGMTEDQLVTAVPGYHALVVRSATRITRRVIAAATDLRVIGRAGVGVDNVDSEAATERGIVVMNTPTGNTITTAELALALLLALARHVARGDRQVRKGSWSKKNLTGSELTGKQLGVVGLGRIGRVVADRALGLKMRVVAYDPYLSGSSAQVAPGAPEIDLVDLDRLLATSDFVTLHVPLMDSTRNLISKERIARMKPGARLVNAARGGLVDEAALLQALESGHLAGAALDVFAEEPPPKDHPLLQRDDVIVTPHLGASSHEAQQNVAVDVAHQVCEFLIDGVAHNAVNAPAVNAQTLREIAPYVLLSEKLGSFLAQVAGAPIHKIELRVSGEIARKDHRHVSLALLVGILRQGMDIGVNFVNAPLLARQRGIELFESSEDEDEFFHSRIRVRVDCAASSPAGGKRAPQCHSVAGTVFGRAPKILSVDDMPLDLDPRGPILITRHADRPGVVGLLGTVLGAQGVNIRRIELGPPPETSGRESASEPPLATGFLSLYDEPGPHVLARLAELEPVREVRLVRL